MITLLIIVERHQRGEAETISPLVLGLLATCAELLGVDLAVIRDVAAKSSPLSPTCNGQTHLLGSCTAVWCEARYCHAP